MKLKITLFLLVFLSGCATKLTQQQSNDLHFEMLVEKTKTNIDAVSYDDIWTAYLQSSYTENSALAYDDYLTQYNNVSNGLISCGQVDFERLLKSDYLSIKPHLFAAECAEKMGNIGAAEYHQNFVQKILLGVLDKVDGANYYQAYIVGNWGSAEDILELAGYKVIDRRLEFKGLYRGIYYVVLVEDLETGKQKNIYFDTTDYFNSAIGYYGRLGNLDKPIGVSVIKDMLDSGAYVQMALGDVLVYEKNYELAESWFQKAALAGSSYAYLKLAKLCFNKQLNNSNPEACADYTINAAETENVEALLVLSELYKYGWGVEKDISMSQQLFAISNEKLSDGESYGRLGSLYSSGFFGNEQKDNALPYFENALEWGWMDDAAVAAVYQQKVIKGDKGKIESWLKKYSEKGSPMAQYLYAIWLMDTADRDEKKQNLVMELINLSAKQNFPAALGLKGVMVESGVHSSQSESAEELYYKAASMWNNVAQYRLAKELEKKQTELCLKIDKKNCLPYVKYDHHASKQAFAWMRASAESGYEKAISDLGYYYDHGIGTTEDDKKALDLYEIASKKGIVQATYNWGWMLKYSSEIENDIEKAYELFSIAYNNGDVGSANELGIMYENGEFVDKDLLKAKEFYEIAAKQNYKWAQYNLGMLYFNGTGVTKDLEKAKYWLQKAADAGHTGAKNIVLKL